MHIFDRPAYVQPTDITGVDRGPFWPAFTDIMIVVMMIFMFTMVAVVIKNAELISKIKESYKKEELAKKKIVEMEKLRNMLVILKNEIAEREEHIDSLKLDVSLKDVLLFEKDKMLSEKDELINEREELLLIKDKIINEKDMLLSEKVALLSEKDALLLDKDSKLSEKDSILLEKDTLISESRRELLSIRLKQVELEASLTEQQREYSTLREKYLKLIKPARSPLNKTQVTVSFSRVNDRPRIQFIDVGKKDYENINKDELHRRLTDLKRRYGNNLYVKIIIPENSNLSYSEAWTFTQNILSMYDYYYQD